MEISIKLGEKGTQTVPLKKATADFEMNYIMLVIAECNNDKTQAAAALGISVASLYRKLYGYNSLSKKQLEEKQKVVDILID